MRLNTREGHLTLGSVYKLFLVGWLLSWGAFFALIFAILAIGAAVTGQMYVNGDVVAGRGRALLAMAPALILFPLVITIQAFMFAGFLTFGIWLYRLRRPLLLVSALPESAQVAGDRNAAKSD